MGIHHAGVIIMDHGSCIWVSGTIKKAIVLPQPPTTSPVFLFFVVRKITGYEVLGHGSFWVSLLYRYILLKGLTSICPSKVNFLNVHPQENLFRPWGKKNYPVPTVFCWPLLSERLQFVKASISWKNLDLSPLSASISWISSIWIYLHLSHLSHLSGIYLIYLIFLNLIYLIYLIYLILYVIYLHLLGKWHLSKIFYCPLPQPPIHMYLSFLFYVCQKLRVMNLIYRMEAFGLSHLSHLSHQSHVQVYSMSGSNLIVIYLHLIYLIFFIYRIYLHLIYLFHLPSISSISSISYLIYLIYLVYLISVCHLSHLQFVMSSISHLLPISSISSISSFFSAPVLIHHHLSSSIINTYLSWLSGCLSAWLPGCLSAYLSICLAVGCLAVWTVWLSWLSGMSGCHGCLAVMAIHLSIYLSIKGTDITHHHHHHHHRHHRHPCPKVLYPWKGSHFDLVKLLRTNFANWLQIW